ncbi:MAG: YggT family protein [Gammaproteobacteria bacterium]
MSGGNYIAQALVFLVRTVFDLYLIAVTLRFLFQLIKVDFYNPISQFLVKITNPPLRILRRVIPGYGAIDWSSVVLMLTVKACQIALISLIVSGRIPALSGLMLLSLSQIINLVIYIFIIAIFVQIILSWINPGAYNPATAILYQLTEPLLRPARRLLPPMGGLDLSPILVLVFLQLTIILIVNPLAHMGQNLAGYSLM